MVVTDKLKNTSGTVKVIAATVTSIAVAWVGAWQTVAAASSDPSLSKTQQSQVREIVGTESPITANDRVQLYQTLDAINNKLTNVQIIVAGDHVLIQSIVKNTKP